VKKKEETRMTDPIGVGIVGTGLAFQAIHARVLADMTGQFAICAVWDPDRDRAAAAAQWLGARAAADCDDLFADPRVDVVVIASPARFHAEQAIAAMRAGKRAVLVEKPLCATPEEAEAVAREAQARGVILLVGAMHTHDPAWLAARDVLADTAFKPALIRSSIVLPPNARFEEWATEPLLSVATQGTPPAMGPDQFMRLCILELAIHDLPLVRRLLPQGERPHVVAARLRQPFGYAVTVRVGDVLVDLSGVIHGHWQTDWTVEATGPQGALKLDFTPSFVAAGSGAMTWEGTGGTRAHLPSESNGYAGQWQAIAAMLRGLRDVPDPWDLAEDFRFAHAIAEEAGALCLVENAA
jgi:predicted dehydrogenase